MTRPSTLARANHTNNYTVVRKGNQSVMQHSMAALHEGEWVVDDVLMFYLRHLVSPTRAGIHSYDSHFMDHLLDVDEAGVPAGYKYNNVRRYHRRIEEDFWELSQLFIPINKGRNHWLFARVVFENKSIEIWDSLGADEDSKQFARDIRRYLYDLKHRTPGSDSYIQGAPSFGEWCEEWKCLDMTRFCPQQTNSDDCGIFTMVSITLLANGHNLTRSSYNQEVITYQQTRRRIAFMIMEEAEKEAANSPNNLVSFLTRRPGQAAAGRRIGKTSSKSSKGKKEGKQPSSTKHSIAKSPRQKVSDTALRRQRAVALKLGLKRDEKSLADGKKMEVDKVEQGGGEKKRKRKDGDRIDVKRKRSR